MIRLDPTLAAPYNNRALAFRDKGDFDRALADAEDALRRDPKSVAIYSARGEIWRMKGDLDRALADQNQAVRMDPKSPLPFLRRGDTFRYRGELAARSPTTTRRCASRPTTSRPLSAAA